MRVKYNQSTTINLGHAYAVDGRLRDVKIHYPASTLAAWRQRQVRYREQEGSVQLWTRVDEADNPYISPGEYSIQFGLQPEYVEQFLAVTDLDVSLADTWSSGKRFLIHNRNVASATLAYELIDGIKSQAFKYTFPFTGTGTGTLNIKDLSGNVLVTRSGLSANDADQYIADLVLDLAPALYQFESTDTVTTVTERIYLHEELARMQVTGLLELNWSPLVPSAYQFTFGRKTQRWYYHIVKKNTTHLADFDLSILDASGDNDPNLYQTYTFAEKSELDFPREAINGLETLVFESNGPIPYYESPKTGLQLRKTPTLGGAAIPIVNDLPNPPRVATGRDHATIYVFV